MGCTRAGLVGAADIRNNGGGLDSPVNRLRDGVNPLRSVDPLNELTRAVIRLPLHNGVAEVERSIAFETKKFGATASGKLDFRTQTLDLAIRPQVRQGVPLDIPQVVDLVRFRGPFASPAVAIDSVATASTIARIGAAAYTGGLSIIGESLLSRASGSPCEIALGRTSGAMQTPGGAVGAIVYDTGKALGRAVHRCPWPPPATRLPHLRRPRRTRAPPGAGSPGSPRLGLSPAWGPQAWDARQFHPPSISCPETTVRYVSPPVQTSGA